MKNTHLRRCPHPSSLRRTGLYASLLGISGALHLDVFDQPARQVFSMMFNLQYATSNLQLTTGN
jgi:hypothetical protein